MVKSTALKIQEVIGSPITEKVEVTCPITASGAYRQGLDMELLLGEIYGALAARCKNQTAQEVLKEVVKQNKRDVADIMECFKFALNCEIDIFYQGQGIVFPADINEHELIYTKLIIRNLENQFARINTIFNEINEQTTEELGNYFDAKTQRDLLELVLNVRNNSQDLYGRLAQLYPAGKIREAFTDMAEIISDGNQKLS